MGTKSISNSRPKTTVDRDDPTAESSRNAVSHVTPLSFVLQKQANNIQTYTSLSSQDGSLFSQTSTNSVTTSLFSQCSLQSERSIQSQRSLQSQLSLASQGSLQSEISPYSQTSLRNLPSLGCFQSEAKVKGGQDYCCITTLKGHNDQVSSLALEGELLYSGSSSKNIRVWFKDNFRECCKFGNGKGVVKALAVVGDRIFSAHQDHKVRVWKRSPHQQKIGHELIATIPTVRDYLLSLIQPKNYVQVRRHKKRLWIEHVDTISVLVVSKSDKVLYTGSWDRSVKVWRLSDFKCVESFKAHDDAVNAIALSEDKYVYTGSADTKIKVWLKSGTTEKKREKHTFVTSLESHKLAVNALALSSDGSILYSGAGDRDIVVWQREDCSQHMLAVGALQGHRHAILCIASIDDMLCSGSADKTVRVWKRNSVTIHSCLAVLHGHTAPIKCISVSRSNNSEMGCTIYSGSADHDIKVWCVSSCLSSDKDTNRKESKKVLLKDNYV